LTTCIGRKETDSAQLGPRHPEDVLPKTILTALTIPDDDYRWCRFAGGLKLRGNLKDQRPTQLGGFLVTQWVNKVC